MTISSNEPRKAYNGNGSTVDFTTPVFQVEADLKVYVDEVLQTLTTHYTVTGGSGSTGTVSFVTAPATGTANVTIFCDPAMTQGLDLVENDANPAETREAAFDKLTLLVQRLSERLDRALTLADSDGQTDAVLTLPSESDRASSFLAFDADGEPIATSGVSLGAATVSTFVETMLDDADDAAVRTTIGKDNNIYSATITPASDADVTLSAAENKADRLILVDGSWTADHNIITDTTERRFWVDNSSGTYNPTVKTSAGTGIIVPAGASKPLICDGTNIVNPHSGNLIDEVVVTGSAATTITFSNLDINTHKSYRIIFRYKNAGTNSGVSIYFGGDTTVTNYHRQSAYFSDATLIPARQNSTECVYASAPKESIAFIDVILSPSGYAVATSYVARDIGSAIAMQEYAIIKSSGTLANITSIQLSSAVASQLDVDTSAEIYAGAI